MGIYKNQEITVTGRVRLYHGGIRVTIAIGQIKGIYKGKAANQWAVGISHDTWFILSFSRIRLDALEQYHRSSSI